MMHFDEIYGKIGYSFKNKLGGVISWSGSLPPIKREDISNEKEDLNVFFAYGDIDTIISRIELELSRIYDDRKKGLLKALYLYFKSNRILFIISVFIGLVLKVEDLLHPPDGLSKPPRPSSSGPRPLPLDIPRFHLPHSYVHLH